MLLAIACLGVLKLDANGLTTEESYTKDFDSVIGQQMLTDHGLADQSNPVMVVSNADQATEVAKALGTVDGLGDVSRAGDQGRRRLRQRAHRGRRDVPGGVRDRRPGAGRGARRADGADALVAGTTAIFDDIEQASQRDNKVVIPIVLLAVMLILVLLLRPSLVSPILLIATVVLAFGAALGLSSLLFHYVFGFAGADASLPLFVFVFLVALGIDYNIFLMTRVREETQVRGTRQGSLVALAATGGVITSAGIVLAATFLVLTTMPLVAFAEIGIAVALGVLLDTLIVRSVLVTALNLDLGSRIWWPSRLDRDPPTQESLDTPQEAGVS